MTKLNTAPDRTSDKPRAAVLRTDIQGLRAVAVGAVILYHFWPRRLPGGYVGVDVFLVISGFLITGHLLRSPITSIRDLGQFWARRIRRLIPAACLVLAAALAASVVWLPETLIPRIGREVLASALYVENWYLAGAATDYLAADELHTPVQHYWSLSVEEQFYIVWPVLFGGVALVSAWRQSAARWIPIAATAAVVLASLAYSIAYTSRDPAPAYFVSTTRAWELGAGALLAAVFAGRSLSLTPVLRAAMAWVGLVMIGWAALAFSASTVFPGAAALLPVLGTVLLIAASASDAKWGPGRLLSLRPMQWVGDISYSAYLWHWPVAVIAPFALGRELTWPDKLLLIGLSLLLADATKRLVEDPIRFWPVMVRRIAPNLATLVVGVGIVGALSAAMITTSEAAQDRAETAAATEQDRLGSCFGAGAARNADLCNGFGTELVTQPIAARNDLPFIYEKDCRNTPPYDTRKTCQFGADDPELRIALVGNSHAAHWVPALEEVVAANPGAQVTTYLMSVCYTVDIEVVSYREGDCQGITRWSIDEVANGDYDLVVISNRSNARLAGVSKTDKLRVARDAYRRTLTRFVDGGAGVVVVRDTPFMVDNVPDCIAEHDLDWKECSVPVGVALESDPLADVAPGVENVELLDLSDYFCDGSVCNPVVGSAIAFHDHGHLTDSFSRSLAPDLCDALAEVPGGEELQCLET